MDSSQAMLLVACGLSVLSVCTALCIAAMFLIMRDDDPKEPKDTTGPAAPAQPAPDPAQPAPVQPAPQPGANTGKWGPAKPDYQVRLDQCPWDFPLERTWKPRKGEYKIEGDKPCCNAKHDTDTLECARDRLYSAVVVKDDVVVNGRSTTSWNDRIMATYPCEQRRDNKWYFSRRDKGKSFIDGMPDLTDQECTCATMDKYFFAPCQLKA